MLLELLRGQGIQVAAAGITLPNPASVALHESLGFEPVGVWRRIGWKRGASHDVGWWQLDLIPAGEDPPGEVTPPVSLVDRHGSRQGPRADDAMRRRRQAARRRWQQVALLPPADIAYAP